MFDNPRKELERLQQELLAAEEPEKPEEDYTAPLEWDEEEREPLSHSYTEDADDTRIWEIPEEPEKETLEEPEKPPKKHYVGLKFAIALELLGIAALFWWWYLWIR